MKKPSLIVYALSLLSLISAVGFMTSYMSENEIITQEEAHSYLLLFLLVFTAIQLPLALLLDKLRINGRIIAVTGLLVSAIALLVGTSAPALCIILLSLGTGAFHIASMTDLYSDGRSFTRVAFYLSTSALGYAVGSFIGEKNFFFSPYHFVFVSLFLAGAVWCFCDSNRADIVVPEEKIESENGKRTPMKTILTAQVPSLLLLASASSLLAVALKIAPTTPSDSSLAPILPPLACFFGIAAGGALTDLLGCRRVGAFAPLLSAPLLVLGAESLPLHLAGLALASVAVAPVFVLLARRLPSRTATASALGGLAFSVAVAVFSLFPLDKNVAAIISAVAMLLSAVVIFLTANDIRSSAPRK